MRFESDSIFALAGADTPAFLDDQAVAMHRTLRAEAGAVLRLGMARTGLRIYLAASGGIAVPEVMGSRATFQHGGFGGLNGRALASGDNLPLGTIPEAIIPDRTVPQALIPVFSSDIVVRAIPSHESDRFTADGLARFFSASYSVSQKSDRMGCRLEGPVIGHSAGADIISSGVQTGTVQVPGDGQPIVLMADRQTTGGYTRIAQVICADLPFLGQARPGDTVRFVKCTPAEAAKALEMQLESLNQVKAAVLQADTKSQDHHAKPNIPVTIEDLLIAPEAQSMAIRQYQVSIDGRSYTVTLEEL